MRCCLRSVVHRPALEFPLGGSSPPPYLLARCCRRSHSMSEWSKADAVALQLAHELRSTLVWGGDTFRPHRCALPARATPLLRAGSGFGWAGAARVPRHCHGILMISRGSDRSSSVPCVRGVGSRV